MDRSKQREIASKGGKAAHQKGTAHEWTSEKRARRAARAAWRVIAASRSSRAGLLVVELKADAGGRRTDDPLEASSVPSRTEN
jgi:hypothetical protein